MKRCLRCVTPASRPRIEFDSEGVCLACRWHEQKQKIDWGERRKRFMEICDQYRSDSPWNCIIPVSGGKDSSYVSWKVKHEYGMNPLCVTFAPQIQTPIGRQNLENFRQAGFNHLMITPDAEAYRRYAKDWFVRYGFPKQPFVVGISTSILRLARYFGIRLIVWGEQGEKEYSGNSGTFGLEKFDRDFLVNCYYEGQDDSEQYGPWWKVPEQSQLDGIVSTWFSLYDDWDPDTHARLANKECGMQLVVGGSIGTFTCGSQLDDVLQDLHTYLMFVKHGFGRCVSDASIEIRRGRMTREEGVKVVNKLDGLFPLEYLDAYCDYFEMSYTEFWRAIDSLANTELLWRTNHPERPWALKELVK